MSVRRSWVVAAALLLGGMAVLGGAPAPAYAAKKAHENKPLGFKITIDDSWTQSPPKLTADEAYLVGEWYQDAAKFDSGPGLRPEFKIFWFAESKKPQAPTAEAPLDPGRRPSEDEIRAMMRDKFGVKSMDEHVERMLDINTRLFGPAIPMAERWQKAEKSKTNGKVPIPFEQIEINPTETKKRKDGSEQPHGYGYAARMTLDRPDAKVDVGFFGICGREYVKEFSKQFEQIVKSFTELRSAADSTNSAAQQDLAEDPVKRREQVRQTKVIKGWKCVDTKNYILLHHEEVDPALARTIGDHIEAIRAQVYEILFPPDRPITAVCIIRVCKDQEQYMGYGAPGGSAGYWSPYHEELVFYENGKKDSLSVLYHEAFHQYIHYSVGDFAPHSWFNEGHGDFFAGHRYKGGKFAREPFQWRISEAKEWKRSPVRPPLREWVNWTQAQYYGQNKQGIPGGANYALGWSLVYFLRTTKIPAYQGVLDRYFNTLKGSVTRSREAEESWEKKLKEWEEKRKTQPDLPPPERGSTSDVSDNPVEWLSQANKEAFKDIDWDAIERDWLASDY